MKKRFDLKDINPGTERCRPPPTPNPMLRGMVPSAKFDALISDLEALVSIHPRQNIRTDDVIAVIAKHKRGE